MLKALQCIAAAAVCTVAAIGCPTHAQAQADCDAHHAVVTDLFATGYSGPVCGKEEAREVARTKCFENGGQMCGSPDGGPQGNGISMPVHATMVGLSCRADNAPMGVVPVVGGSVHGFEAALALAEGQAARAGLFQCPLGKVYGPEVPEGE